MGDSTKQESLEDIPTISIINELKRRIGMFSQAEKRVILVGAPGSGKGTQSANLQKDYNLCHISTGDLLRDAVQNSTPLGLQAKRTMDRGELVSDSIVLSLLEEKMNTPQCSKGFILDGFPRNLSQAKALETLMENKKTTLDGIIYFHIDEEELKRRVCGRRVHTPSGRLYHVEFQPPKVPNKDDITGEPLVHRKDDNEETLARRMKSFRNETMPLLDHYSKMGLLYKIDAQKPTNLVRAALVEVVEGRSKPTTV